MRRTLALIFALCFISGLAYAEVNVTYKVNTSTVTGIGIADSTHQVQVRGSEVGPPGEDLWQNNFLTWDDTSPMAQNTGGDSWELTIAYPDSMIGWRMAYKIAYKHNQDDEFTWESFDGNRMYTLPDEDTTLAMAYVNNAWDPPYTETDSLDVFFRVNMGGQPDFDPNNQSVYIVGAFPGPDGADNMWVPDKYMLTREGETDFWSYHLPLDTAAAPYDSTMYRFTLGDWGNSEGIYGHGMFPDNENRGISVSEDTTVAWKWYNDQPPAGFTGQDTVDLTFYANMENAINNNGFQIGDTLLVRFGYFGSSSSVLTDTLIRQSGTQNYFVTMEEVPVSQGEYLYYQYYILRDGLEQREIYYNFAYDGPDPSAAERRRYMVESTDEVTIQDIQDSESDERRMPVFRNNNLLAQSVTVTLTCDIRPAVYTVLAGSTLVDIQANFSVTPSMMAADPDTIFDMGVYVNGPMSNDGEGTWQTWGGTLANDTTRMMFDDGTHGDQVAGDSIYSVIVELHPDSNHTVGQEFKFGIGGGDNEGGYGNNHIENVDDSESSTTVAAQFGSIDPLFYSAWDFDAQEPVTSIEDGRTNLATEFRLGENYPNPFNPSTTFRYTIPEEATVSIAIFNILGQEVYSRTVDQVSPGSYTFTWDGTNHFGQQVTSGVYFYRVNAGEFMQTKKMVLMK